MAAVYAMNSATLMKVLLGVLVVDMSIGVYDIMIVYEVTHTKMI